MPIGANRFFNITYGERALKNLRVACDRHNIDGPRRRTLGHLLTCCQIVIVPNGYRALEVLAQKSFELIIIDSEITAIGGMI